MLPYWNGFIYCDECPLGEDFVDRYNAYNEKYNGDWQPDYCYCKKVDSTRGDLFLCEDGKRSSIVKNNNSSPRKTGKLYRRQMYIKKNKDLTENLKNRRFLNANLDCSKNEHITYPSHKKKKFLKRRLSKTIRRIHNVKNGNCYRKYYK